MDRANSHGTEKTNQPDRGLMLEISLAGSARGEHSANLIGRLREAIHGGSLREGASLPPTRVLAADLGVSRGVVVRAYEQLTAEGYLHSRQGSGTVVAAVPQPPPSSIGLPPRPPTNPGLPAGSLFPRSEWARALNRVISEIPDADLGYPDPSGLHRLRHELAGYLGRVRALRTTPDNIVITSGFGQAARLVTEILAGEGTQAVGLEDPGSVGLREQLTRVGINCRPVPVDEHGVQVDELSRMQLRTAVVTPAHQFPTGVVMSPERRHALVNWARASGSTVIEDDYDAEFRYDRTPVGALQGIGPDVVVYGGSVSKTLTPGLRLGWLVVPDRLVTSVRDAKYDADLGTSVLDQATLAEFIASGSMDRHIRRTSHHYRERRDRLVSAISEHLPSWKVTGTAAGLHAVVHPAPECDETILAKLAQRCGLDARPLSRYTVDKSRAPGLVVGYGHQRPAALERAVAALATALGPSRPRTDQTGLVGDDDQLRPVPGT